MPVSALEKNADSTISTTRMQNSTHMGTSFKRTSRYVAKARSLQHSILSSTGAKHGVGGAGLSSMWLGVMVDICGEARLTAAPAIDLQVEDYV